MMIEFLIAALYATGTAVLLLSVCGIAAIIDRIIEKKRNEIEKQQR